MKKKLSGCISFKVIVDSFLLNTDFLFIIFMRSLSKVELIDYINGAVILGCGGGGDELLYFKENFGLSFTSGRSFYAVTGRCGDVTSVVETPLQYPKGTSAPKYFKVINK